MGILVSRLNRTVCLISCLFQLGLLTRKVQLRQISTAIEKKLRNSKGRVEAWRSRIWAQGQDFFCITSHLDLTALFFDFKSGQQYQAHADDRHLSEWTKRGANKSKSN